MLSFRRAMPLGNQVDMIKVDNTPDPTAPAAHMKMELVDFEIDVGFGDGDEIVLLADIERAVLMVSQVVDRCEARL